MLFAACLFALCSAVMSFVGGFWRWAISDTRITVHETTKQLLESLMGAQSRDSACVCDEIRWRHRQKELAALYCKREKK
ncbi:hypothetical protein V8C40DRAFT_234019 [Trichoderma camerunense]